MFQIISIMIALGIGFACGFGVRELKSRRRRDIARTYLTSRSVPALHAWSGGNRFKEARRPIGIVLLIFAWSYVW